MKIKFMVAIVIFMLAVSGSKLIFAEAISDDQDLAKFIRFRTRLLAKISDRERTKINFAIAEFYFKTHDFIDAKRAFEEYVSQNPIGITALLAKAYLYKSANLENNQKKMEAIKKEMFEKQFILLFDKYKTLKDASLNGNLYEVHYYVDKIEIFLNGAIFEQISP